MLSVVSEGTENINKENADMGRSPVIRPIDWCPCVGPDSSIYVPLPKMIHKEIGIRNSYVKLM